MHRQELRAGSRRAYHPGVGWNLGAAKSCMFQSLGSEDLYPVVRTRFSVVYGNAFFDSTDGGCLAYYLLTARRDATHPTRASERGRAKGRPDDAWSKFQNRQPSLDQQHISNFDRSLSLATSVSGISLPAWSHITFLRCDSKYCCGC